MRLQSKSQATADIGGNRDCEVLGDAEWTLVADRLLLDPMVESDSDTILTLLRIPQIHFFAVAIRLQTRTMSGQ